MSESEKQRAISVTGGLSVIGGLGYTMGDGIFGFGVTGGLANFQLRYWLGLYFRQCAPFLYLGSQTCT